MKSHHPTLTRWLCATSTLALAGALSNAHATGFQIREQSTKALANALSGAAAGAEDAAFMAYNPAAIGHLDGTQVTGSLSYIDPDFDFEDGQASTATGSPYAGTADNGGESALVPSLAFKTGLTDTIDAGLAVYAPYGLKTEYDRNWIGRYHAIETELETIDIQPTISLRVFDGLALAAGLRFQYAEATLSNALDLGARAVRQGDPRASVGGNDGIAEINGDDWGTGYTLGALYQVTEATRFGISYRSEIDLELTGDARFNSDDPIGQAVLQGARAGGRFTDTGGRADLTTPATLNLGVHHQTTDRITLMANAEWTEWSEFDELRVEFADATPDSVTQENWNNTWAVSVGANYVVSPRWLLRGGVGFDESPVPDARRRTPRVPGSDRQWLSAGATFTPTERLSVTGAVMHIFFDDTEVDLKATDPGNESRGNLSGSVDGSANLVSIQADYRF